MRRSKRLVWYVVSQVCQVQTEVCHVQDLNQADISVLRKAGLKDRLAKSRKAFDDENKAREKTASKAVS